MTKAIKIEFCTSCGSQDLKVTGNTYYCPDCDVTFKVTTQGTKVVDSNPLGKEKARIDQLENDVADLKGTKEPGPGPAEPAAPAASDEEEEEQDGFITIVEED